MSPMRDGRTNDERTREDRATQPMEAGWLSFAILRQKWKQKIGTHSFLPLPPWSHALPCKRHDLEFYRKIEATIKTKNHRYFVATKYFHAPILLFTALPCRRHDLAFYRKIEATIKTKNYKKNWAKIGVCTFSSLPPWSLALPFKRHN